MVITGYHLLQQKSDIQAYTWQYLSSIECPNSAPDYLIGLTPSSQSDFYVDSGA